MRGYVKIPHIVRIILNSGGNIIDAAVAVEYAHFTLTRKSYSRRGTNFSAGKTSPRHNGGDFFARKNGLIESVALPDFVIFAQGFEFDFIGFVG